jgi:hypothetical protein
MNDYGELTDFDDRRIEIDTRVRLWDYDPHHPDYSSENHTSYMGTVIDLGEWDGDHDNEGRSISIPPYVTVRWDNGDSDEWRTSEWEFECRTILDDWPEQYPVLGKVEELAVIGPPNVGHVKLRRGMHDL